MTNKEKLAYTAGLIDGEGTISCYEVKNGQGRPFLRPEVAVAQGEKQIEVLHWLEQNYGGRVHLQAPRYLWGGFHRVGYWRLNGTKAVELVSKLYPYLIVKREQALRLYPDPRPKWIEDRKIARQQKAK